MRKKQIRKLKTGEIKELDLGGVAGRGGGGNSSREKREEMGGVGEKMVR